MISFQKATEKDISAIRELAEKSWNAAYKSILSQDQIDFMLAEMYSSKLILAQLKNENYHYYLIESDKKQVGFMGFENHYAYETTKLHRIYLLEEAKGKSIGKKAVQFLKKLVQDALDKRIILNVNKGNVAIKFYESQGFEIYEKGIFDIGNGFVMDDYLMEFTY